MYTILLIEDNKTLNSNTKEYLELEGFEVITAFDGASGIRKGLHNDIDLILLDIIMPITDGFFFLRERKKSKLKNIPTIVISASFQQEAISKAFEFGATDYICKPYNYEDLHTKINDILDS